MHVSGSFEVDVTKGRTLTFEDFTGDGFTDVAYFTEDEVAVVLVNPALPGGGPYLPATPFFDLPEIDLDTQAFPKPAIHAADVDGDGWPDAVVSTFEYGTWMSAIYLRDPAATGPLSASSWRERTLQVARGIPVDLDGDGDQDLAGNRAYWNAQFAMPGGGYRRQYGQGSPGSGGRVPKLGAQGPFRVGETIELHLNNAVGGSTGFLVHTSGEASLPGFLIPGDTLLVDPFASFVALFVHPVPGPAGVPGAGASELVFQAGPVLDGFDMYHQTYVIDPGAPGLLSSSNGLRLTYGVVDP